MNMMSCNVTGKL